MLQSGKLQVVLSEQRVYLAEQEIPLSGLTFRLLVVLLEARQQTVSYAELAMKVWRKEFVSDEAIAQRVSLLRKALGDEKRTLIESVRGEGYRWRHSVSAVKQTQTQHPAAGSMHPSYPLPWYRTRRGVSRITGAIFIAVLLGIIWLEHSEPEPVAVFTGSTGEPGQMVPAPPMLSRAEQYLSQHTAQGNELAIALFRQLYEAHPNHVRITRGLASALIQRVAKFSGDATTLAEADSLSAQVLAAHPDDWQAIRLRGYYFDVSGDLPQAIHFYERALVTPHPIPSGAAGALAYLYVRQGRLQEAMQLNLQALQGSGPYRILQIAEIYHLADLQPQAQQWIEAAYQFARADNFTVAQFASQHLSQGDYEGAEQALNAAIASGAASEDLYVLLAKIAMRRQDWREAERQLHKAAELQPQSPYHRALLYWLNQTQLRQAGVEAPSIRPTARSWPNLFVAACVVDFANGQIESGLEALSQAVNLGYLDSQYLIQSPVFAALQEHPRFIALIQLIEHNKATERVKLKQMTLPDLNTLSP